LFSAGCRLSCCDESLISSLSGGGGGGDLQILLGQTSPFETNFEMILAASVKKAMFFLHVSPGLKW
jgi:hypothetical protein